MCTFNCFCCSEISPVLKPEKVAINGDYGALATPRGPKVQRMEQVAQNHFDQANERAKLLDTPPSQRDAPPPYTPPTEPKPPAAQVTIHVEVTVHSPPTREVRKLTVEDIVKERYLTHPDLMRQYQTYLNSFRIIPVKEHLWSFRN